MKIRSMEDGHVVDALNRAKNGITQYLNLMEELYSTDVSTDKDFQRKYNAFYGVIKRKQEWYCVYFCLLERYKYGRPDFALILDEIRKALDKYEPSFSSKLLATINPWKPVWDKYVLKNTGHRPPLYTSKNKFEKAKDAYHSIERWYERFMSSDEARNWISLFNQHISEYYKITDIKKIDFILWQIRS